MDGTRPCRGRVGLAPRDTWAAILACGRTGGLAEETEQGDATSYLPRVKREYALSSFSATSSTLGLLSFWITCVRTRWLAVGPSRHPPSSSPEKWPVRGWVGDGTHADVVQLHDGGFGGVGGWKMLGAGMMAASCFLVATEKRSSRWCWQSRSLGLDRMRQRYVARRGWKGRPNEVTGLPGKLQSHWITWDGRPCTRTAPKQRDGDGSSAPKPALIQQWP